MYAGIETGGTKTVCAVGSDGSVAARTQFPTGDDPEVLAGKCAEFFADHEIESVGIGTFGPCDVDPDSLTYGHILETPKPGWAHVDLLGLLQARIAVPMTLTTDVNAAALGELRYGNAQGYNDVVYITVGTGIGGGVVAGGRLSPNRQHPEMGHMLLPQSVGPGVCPYHGNCFEGLAAGPGMQARAGVPAQDLADDDPAWDVEADIVTAGLHNITLVLAPQCIVIGGGLGSRDALHSRLPGRLTQSLNGYVPLPALRKPGLGSDAGVVGALTLAQDHSQG
ncbi:MAG: ROK family protein [Candidatus Nanopelagicales bacterium]